MGGSIGSGSTRRSESRLKNRFKEVKTEGTRTEFKQNRVGSLKTRFVSGRVKTTCHVPSRGGQAEDSRLERLAASRSRREASFPSYFPALYDCPSAQERYSRLHREKANSYQSDAGIINNASDCAVSGAPALESFHRNAHSRIGERHSCRFNSRPHDRPELSLNLPPFLTLMRRSSATQLTPRIFKNILRKRVLMCHKSRS
jgi:hypothetical protein